MNLGKKITLDHWLAFPRFVTSLKEVKSDFSWYNTYQDGGLMLHQATFNRVNPDLESNDQQDVIQYMIPMGTPSFKNKDIKLKGSKNYTGLKHVDIFTYLVIVCKDGIKLFHGQLDTLQTQS